jgi:hypothetical protein
MACSNPNCRSRFNANDSDILCSLPAYATSAYPVESKYTAGNRNSHIGRNATDVFDLILPTYGNGDLCSQLLYNAMNRWYMERVTSYYSYLSEHQTEREGKEAIPYVDKDGYYITSYPPLGDTIRDLYDEASNTNHNSWCISDHNRHTREMQGVQCNLIFEQDHTHEVTKNYFYKRKLGAEALRDAETGKIASAILVPSTKTIHFLHAARQLAK